MNPSESRPLVSLPFKVCEVARRRPHRTALLNGDTRITYRELVDRFTELGVHLSRAGVSSGAIVGAFAGSCVWYVVSLLALRHIGAVVVLMAHDGGKSQWDVVANNLSLDYLVAPCSREQRIPHPFTDLSCTTEIILEEAGSGSIWIARIDRDKAQPRAALPGVDYVFCSSGTSGEPKLVAHSEATLAAGAQLLRNSSSRIFRTLLDACSISLLSSIWRRRRAVQSVLRAPKWLTSMPFNTISGHTFAALTLRRGQTLVMFDGDTPSEVLRVVRRAGVTHLACPTTFAASLAQLAATERATRYYRTLFIIGVGSSRVSCSLLEQLRESFGCVVAAGYGMTETGGAVALWYLVSARGRSTAKHATLETSIEIRDDRGSRQRNGLVGEIYVRTPGLMLGYLRKGRLNSNLIDNHGWFATGDSGVVDTRGRLTVLGRLDEIINRGGKKFVASDVEACLTRNGSVLCAAVVGVPHETIGQRTWAFVQPEKTYIDLPALRASVAKELATHMVPDEFIVSSYLPTSTNGKVRKAELIRTALQMEDGSDKHSIVH